MATVRAGARSDEADVFTQQPTKLGAIQRRRRDAKQDDRRDGAVAPESRAQIDWVGQIRRLDLPGEVGPETC